MDLLRFEADLEFVQSLSNPQYLNCIVLVVHSDVSPRAKQIL